MSEEMLQDAQSVGAVAGLRIENMQNPFTLSSYTYPQEPQVVTGVHVQRAENGFVLTTDSYPYGRPQNPYVFSDVESLLAKVQELLAKK